jgi:large conductance mechanosensitive channel
MMIQTAIHDPNAAAKAVGNTAKTWMHDFVTFISRGNVIDMAIGIIMGNAFTAIVNSIVNDIISPLIGAAIGINLADANSVLRPGLSGATTYPTPEQARADKAVTVAWGNFIQVNPLSSC